MNGCRTLVVLALALSLAAPNAIERGAVAQTAAKPLGEKELIGLIAVGLEDQTLVGRINKGIQFEVNEEVLANLKKAGASAAVIKAVQAAGAQRAAPAPATPSAGAITYDQVLLLLSAEIGEPAILERLAKSPTVFTLSADQIAALKQAGASDALIKALQTPRAAPSAASELITNVAIVLDCSGSMKETTKEGVTKMEAAKRVVADLIKKIPNGLNVAFVIYGHEAFGGADDPRNCQAVKVARPLGKLDDAGKTELSALVASLKPTGGTPIALSLKVTGEELAKDKDAFCGIVLVTDGLESCKGNPTEEVATLLANLKLSFGVNVVGLGVKADEDAALKAIADAGKGKYYDADDAGALANSIAAIAKELEVKTKPAPIVRSSRRAVKILSPMVSEMPAMAEIVLIESGMPVKEARLYKKASITKYDEEISIPSSTAKYDIVWYPKEGEAILLVKGLSMPERKVIEIRPEEYVGFIKVNGQGTPKTIHAAVKGQPSVLTFSTQRTDKFGQVMAVPVGSYDVYVGGNVIEEGLEVKAGELHELE
jgi:hypothetical protein